MEISRQPMHWKCVKCAMATTQNLTMVESNIASTEVRRRIRGATFDGGFARRVNNSTLDAKSEEDKIVQQKLRVIYQLVELSPNHI